MRSAAMPLSGPTRHAERLTVSTHPLTPTHFRSAHSVDLRWSTAWFFYC